MVYRRLNLLQSDNIDWATDTPIQFLILRSDEEVMTSDLRLKKIPIAKLLNSSAVRCAKIVM